MALVGGIARRAEGGFALEAAMEGREAEPAALRDDADAAVRRVGAQGWQGGEIDRRAEGRGERVGEGEHADRIRPRPPHRTPARDRSDAIPQRAMLAALLLGKAGAED